MPTEDRIGYILWWPEGRRYYYYCTTCSNINMNYWLGKLGKVYPVYKEHLGRFSQTCPGFHIELEIFKGEFSTELFDLAWLATCPSLENLNAQG